MISLSRNFIMHIVQAFVSILGGFILLEIVMMSMQLPGEIKTSIDPKTENPVYLPLIFRTVSPQGDYFCYEYEFGLIWATEVITLNADGSAIYDYSPPNGNLVTGAWSYSPWSQVVSFTNYVWLTTTFDAPDRLWARKYLPQVGFEVAVECYRQ